MSSEALVCSELEVGLRDTRSSQSGETLQLQVYGSHFAALQTGWKPEL